MVVKTSWWDQRKEGIKKIIFTIKRNDPNISICNSNLMKYHIKIRCFKYIFTN